MELPLVLQSILVYAVLGVGVLATLLMGFAQVTGLAKAWGAGPNAALVRRGFLAASVGMGAIGGSILALEVGGPGAIGWMWVASLLGMAIVHADVLFTVRGRLGKRAQAGEPEAKPRASTLASLAALPGIGKPLAYLFALVFVIFALIAGATLQTQQSAALLGTFGGGPWLVVGFLVLAAAIGMAVPRLRAFVAALGPVAIVLYVIAATWILGKAPYSVVEAFQSIVSGMSTGAGASFMGGATGLLVALQIGFLRATLATEAGLGSAGFTPEAEASRRPEEAASAAMLAPLVSGIVVPTLTVLVVMCSMPWTGERLDEPLERMTGADLREADLLDQAELTAALGVDGFDQLSEQDRQRVVALWAPLERPAARGTAASLQAGQTVVLPLDAMAPEGADTDTEGLLEGHVYPMVMRASPRGLMFPLPEGQNELLVARAEETEVIREVVFRDRNPERAKYPAFDVRIPVSNEIVTFAGREFVRLRPVDEGVDLARLSKVRDGPYVVFGDFHFQARIVQMFQNRWGLHHAVIEAEPEPGRPLSLRMTVSSSAFRGPYLDAGEPRPPLAMVAREDFDAQPGARLPMEYRAPARGMAFGHLLTSGELMTPPWRFLAETKLAVIRHKTDPSRDFTVPVTVELVDGSLRFLSGRRDIADFAKADRWAEFTGPYLLPPAYEFQTEVHTGARFPASSSFLDRSNLERTLFEGPFAERSTLVAVHPHGEPQGSAGELYDPHPAEVAPFMDGPYVTEAGIEWLGWASRMSIERGADLLLAISVLILALTTMIAWSNYGARASDYLLGDGAGVGFRLVFLASGLAGVGLGVAPIFYAVDGAMVGLVLLHGIGVVALLVRARTKPAA